MTFRRNDPYCDVLDVGAVGVIDAGALDPDGITDVVLGVQEAKARQMTERAIIGFFIINHVS